jgi:guanylate kinase
MGKVIIITGTSGSGKTTIANKLLEIYPSKLKRIKTTTTRKIRNEDDNESYDFVSQYSFLDDIQNEEFIEYEEVYENVYYGTKNQSIEEALKDPNKHHIICIDVKGATTLKSKLKENCLTIFCDPINYDTIKQRLIERGEDSNKEERLKKFNLEMSYKDTFDIKIDSSKPVEETISIFKVLI